MNPVRRRVLFLIPTLTGGGAERVMVTILRHLDRSRFAPTLAVVNTRNAAFIKDVPDDVELIDLRSSRVRYALPKLVRLIWQRRPDVVLSTLGYLNLALALLRPLLPNGVRYVARETVVLSADLETKRWPWLWRAAYRRFYRRFDTVICQSCDMQKDLVDGFAMPRQKTVLIHNPVDIARIRQLAKTPLAFDDSPSANGPAECLRMVSIGRLTYQKGFDLLIDALALCSRRVKLTVLGEGPLRPQLEQQAIDRGVANQVRFIGFQNNPYPFLSEADVFVLSSRFEGFPNVVLEALACGTPVIALPAPGGVREILDGVGGCIVAESISALDLAQAIERFSSSRALNDQVVGRYATDVISNRYEQVLMVGVAP